MWQSNSEDASLDVFIVTHNHAPWIDQCVSSVVNQTFTRPYNIFVYDDASSKCCVVPRRRGDAVVLEKSDSPRSALFSLRRRWPNLLVTIGTTNLGTVGARNLIAGVGKAALMLFVDGDDWLDSGFLEAAWRKSNFSQADVVYPKVAIVADFGISPHGALEQRPFDFSALLKTNYIPVTSLIRRDRFKTAKGFDPVFSFGFEDWALWIRMAYEGATFVWEQRAVLYYRHHEQARSCEANKRLSDFHTLIRQRVPGAFAGRKPKVEYL